MTKPLFPILLLGASMSFALGVSQSQMEIDRLYFFTATPSLIEVTACLWNHGDYAIAIVSALFSLVFPLAKLTVLHLTAYPSTSGALNVPQWFNALARWSKLDALVVALVIVAAKTSGLASAAAKRGCGFSRYTCC